jgi:hypothetical protein
VAQTMAVETRGQICAWGAGVILNRKVSGLM